MGTLRARSGRVVTRRCTCGRNLVRPRKVPPVHGESPPQLLAFFLAGAAPNAVNLVCRQRILQALASDRAARADGFCLLYLLQRRARGGDGEEQVGVTVQAGGS